MSSRGQTIRGARRRLFFVPAHAALPPLPGEERRQEDDLLATLIDELVEAAGCACIRAPSFAPDASSMTEAFAALRSASHQFDVAPGTPLAERFWTHLAALREGDMSARLMFTGKGEARQGFLALYATEIRSPLLYTSNRVPLRVRDEIGVPRGVEGPFLALIVCKASPSGRMEAVRGYGLPIYHTNRFFPVSSNLDRDVLRVLEHLQVTLDAYGVDCSIERRRPFTEAGETMLTLTIDRPPDDRRTIQLAIDATGNTPPSSGCSARADFLVTNENWANGRFVAWLVSTVRN